MSKTKLELTWIGKDKRPKLEPRILLEDPKLSYHAKFRRYSPSPQAPLPEGEGSKASLSHFGRAVNKAFGLFEEWQKSSPSEERGINQHDSQYNLP